jgi:hypothetical protein
MVGEFFNVVNGGYWSYVGCYSVILSFGLFEDSLVFLMIKDVEIECNNLEEE